MSLIMSLKILDHPVTELKKGDAIIKEATPGGKVYVLDSGKVEISIGGKVIAESDNSGDIFGEIATMVGCNYSATVTCSEDSKFYVIDDFITFLKQNPDDSIKVIKMLCERVVRINESNQLSGI